MNPVDTLLIKALIVSFFILIVLYGWVSDKASWPPKTKTSALLLEPL